MKDYQLKTWRVKNIKEFYQKFEKILDERNEYILNNYEEIFKAKDSKEYYSRFNHFNILLDKINTLENSTRNEDNIEEIIKSKLYIYNEDILHWAQSSLNPKSKEEIILKVLANKIFNVSIICVSYVCGSELLDEDLLSDIIFIQSNVFDFSKWDDIHVDTLVDHYINYYTPNGVNILYSENKKFTNVFGNDKKYNVEPSKLIIDWKAVSMNCTIDLDNFKFNTLIDKSISEKESYVYKSTN